MLKNIMADNFKYSNSCYICIMENLSASEKDKVLNQISVNTPIRLNELNGDIHLNRLIIDELSTDGYINIVEFINYDDNILWLTPKGESFKKIGGYKYFHKKEKIENFKKIIPKIIKWLIGLLAAKLAFSLFYIISK